MDEANEALLVDDEARGHRFGVIAPGDALLPVPCESERRSGLLGELLDTVRLVVLGDTDHDDVVRVLLGERLVLGKGRAARAAPGRPEIHENDLSFSAFEARALAARLRREAEVRRWVAEERMLARRRRGSRPRSAAPSDHQGEDQKPE